MKELIKVTVKENQQLVSARELHKGLQIKTRFSLWVKQNFKDFIESEDFTTVFTTTVVNNGAKKPVQDYVLTVSMAKELSMMSHTEQGRIYRKYFLELERKWNDPKEIVKRAHKILESENYQLKLENSNLKVDNQLMQPKAKYFDDIVERKTLSNFRDTAKMIGLGQKKFIDWLLSNKYVYRDKKRQLRPISTYTGKYFVIKDTSTGHQQTLITPEGRESFNLLFTSD